TIFLTWKSTGCTPARKANGRSPLRRTLTGCAEPCRDVIGRHRLTWGRANRQEAGAAQAAWGVAQGQRHQLSGPSRRGRPRSLFGAPQSAASCWSFLFPQWKFARLVAFTRRVISLARALLCPAAA